MVGRLRYPGEFSIMVSTFRVVGRTAADAYNTVPIYTITGEIVDGSPSSLPKGCALATPDDYGPELALAGSDGSKARDIVARRNTAPGRMCD